jgi:NTP pyrophosphatase (non-canonical NTP hydrolase)
MTLNEYGDRALANQIKHGFVTPAHISEDTTVLAKLMLIVCEVAEAAEAVRDQDKDNFAEELADNLIRAVGMMRGMGIDIDAVVQKKMTFNESRPMRHGRVSAV